MSSEEFFELQSRAFSGARPVREFVGAVVEHACRPDAEVNLTALAKCTSARSMANVSQLLESGRRIAELAQPRVTSMRVLSTSDRSVLRIATRIAGQDGEITLPVGASFDGAHWQIVEIGNVA